MLSAAANCGRHLGAWAALALAGAAIGVHPAVDYMDPVCFAPAVLGALV